MKKIILLLSIIVISINVNTKDKMLKKATLKEIMQGLSSSMNQLSDGIFLEDYSKIEKAAKDIANHPKAKSQLPLILKTLGFSIAKFKSIDGTVHNSATEIGKIAHKKNINEISKKFNIAMNACISCHTQFRDKLVKVLNK